MQLVYLVGGDTHVGPLAQSHLVRAGFEVHVLSPARNWVRVVDKSRPALILIDVIPSSRGIELCRAARATRSLARTPLILLGKETSEQDRVRGLDCGADDFITELSSGYEFIARVRAVMRRFARGPRALQPGGLGTFPCSLADTPAPLKTGDIEIDTLAMRITVRGGEIPATTLEFRLMYYLTHYRSRVFTRDQLLHAVWGTQYANPRLVDACVRRLRRKIEPDRAQPIYLKTIRGAGYCLAA